MVLFTSDVAKNLKYSSPFFQFSYNLIKQQTKITKNRVKGKIKMNSNLILIDDHFQRLLSLNKNNLTLFQNILQQTPTPQFTPSSYQMQNLGHSSPNQEPPLFQNTKSSSINYCWPIRHRKPRSRKAQSSDYEKNVFGHIVKKIIRSATSITFREQVESICEMNNLDYTLFKQFYQSKFEFISGPSHLPYLLFFWGQEQKRLAHSFLQFCFYFLNNRFMRYLLGDGKMFQKQIYLQCKNKVLIPTLLIYKNMLKQGCYNPKQVHLIYSKVLPKKIKVIKGHTHQNVHATAQNRAQIMLKESQAYKLQKLNGSHH